MESLSLQEKNCFLITAEGFVCGKDVSVNHLKYSASYLKYTDLKEVVSDKDGNIYLIHKETNEKILLLKIKEINEELINGGHIGDHRINTMAKKALFDNLGGDAEFTLKVYDAIDFNVESTKGDVPGYFCMDYFSAHVTVSSGI